MDVKAAIPPHSRPLANMADAGSIATRCVITVYTQPWPVVCSPSPNSHPSVPADTGPTLFLINMNKAAKDNTATGHQASGAQPATAKHPEVRASRCLSVDPKGKSRECTGSESDFQARIRIPSMRSAQSRVHAVRKARRSSRTRRVPAQRSWHNATLNTAWHVRMRPQNFTFWKTR